MTTPDYVPSTLGMEMLQTVPVAIKFIVQKCIFTGILNNVGRVLLLQIVNLLQGNQMKLQM